MVNAVLGGWREMLCAGGHHYEAEDERSRKEVRELGVHSINPFRVLHLRSVHLLNVIFGSPHTHYTHSRFGRPPLKIRVLYALRAISVPFTLDYIEKSVKQCPLLRSKLLYLRLRADSSRT